MSALDEMIRAETVESLHQGPMADFCRVILENESTCYTRDGRLIVKEVARLMGWTVRRVRNACDDVKAQVDPDFRKLLKAQREASIEKQRAPLVMLWEKRRAASLARACP